MKIIMTSLVFLVACGGGGWKPAEQDKYLDGCTDLALSVGFSPSESSEFCNCSLSGLQDAYPTYNEFLKDAQKNPTPHEIVDVVADCQEQMEAK